MKHLIFLIIGNLMNFQRLFIFLFLIFSINFLTASSFSDERLQRITAMLDDFVEDKQFPGFVTIITEDGKPILKVVNGYKDIDKKIPMKEDALFRIYSMTKPITGVALMILVDRGLIKLSDPISKFIPEFENTKVVNEAGDFFDLDRPITVLDAATHTSGLIYAWLPTQTIANDIYEEKNLHPYYYLDLEVTADQTDFSIPAEKPYSNICEFAQELASAPLVHQPGEKWTYGVGMDLLGCIIEKVSAMTFGNFLKVNIFDPLDMEDTSFKVPESEINRFTSMYTHKGVRLGDIQREFNDEIFPDDLILMDSYDDSPYLKMNQVEDGGSGLISTAKDYLKFGQMLNNKGRYNDGRILSKEAFEVLSTSQIDNFGFQGLGVVELGVGQAICMAKITQPAFSTFYQSKGSLFWGGAASTYFWADPVEDIVLVHMTQVLGHPVDLRADLDRLTYSSKN